MLKATLQELFCYSFRDFRCIICKTPLSEEPSLCSGCVAMLPWLNLDVCLRCGSLRGNPCADCMQLHEPLHDRFAVFEYAFPIDALLKTLKYQEKRSIGRSLGQLLGQAAKASGRTDSIDCLLPVPLAWPRMRERGFNQAADIAQACSEITRVPCFDQWLFRQADTPKLAGLSPAERRFALLGAFAASEQVADQHVVLIDDVMTSGATTLELNRELLDRGAKTVSVWTIARTVQPKDAAKTLVHQ